MTQQQEFEAILQDAGFIKIRTHEDGDTAWEYRKMGWYADVLGYLWGCEVWMIGPGLKDNPGYPGGWRYSYPEGLREELSKYAD